MNVSLFLAATFLASCVEAVEAVTIVVGVGEAHDWRSAWLGVLAALAALVAIVLVFGVALAALPIGPLRLVVGALLLVFGLGWLRKGIRRVAVRGLSGDVFHEDLGAGPAGRQIDWQAFVIAFKGVLLEGLEVAFIVVSFGLAAHQLGGAALAGLAAAALMALLGAAIHPALRRVPRSVLILVVGVMLSSFGSFWSVEGLGVDWPGSDAAIVALVLVNGAAAAVLLLVERRWHLRNALHPA